VYAWGHVRDFYKGAPIGSPLWIMLCSQATTMTDIADPENDYARKLRDEAGGKIAIMGITRNPGGSYEPSVTEGLDPDVFTAITAAQALVNDSRALNIPVRCIVEGRMLAGDISDLRDLRTMSCNGVACVIGSQKEYNYSAGVGLLMGRLAGIPVDANPGRGSDGAMPISRAYLSSGYAIETVSFGLRTLMNDRGYTFLLTLPGQSGYYWNDAPTACPLTDDYAYLPEGFVIDKAQRIVVSVYPSLRLSKVPTVVGGLVDPGYARALEGDLLNPLQLGLVAKGQASEANVVVETNQNVLATSEVAAQVRVRPNGTLRYLTVELGLSA
jgi:hypothetical protein